MSAATLAGEEASALGRLTILQPRTNPDLAMGNESLKKTGSGNLFMFFGEPDIEVRPAGEGRLTVEVCGLDVYDPATGVLRSSSVDDRRRRPLRSTPPRPEGGHQRQAWDTVNATISRQFPVPKSGKVAIKVINHYGDEVMKVFGV